MATTFYLLRALSNMHPGAGDADFGIIDKHVQRDALTGLPTIHASSIKGSLRQLFETSPAAGITVTDVFGSSSRGDDDVGINDLRQGDHIFYQAKLLGLPVRSNHQLYYLATTPPLLADFLADLQLMGGEFNGTAALQKIIDLDRNLKPGEPRYLGPDAGEIQLEDLVAKNAGPHEDDLTALFGERIAILHVDDFDRLAEELPTVARNSLNNGISVNLWYEEIVPRETRFYCPVTSLNNDQSLDAAVTHINGLVQIGGNATVGMGLTQWTPIQ